MRTIYDADGNPKTLESVDAREYIATGQWFADPPGAATETAAEHDQRKSTGGKKLPADPS